MRSSLRLTDTTENDMAEQREVTIHMDAVEQATVKEAVGAANFYEALGYLSAWNVTYPKVHIHRNYAESGALLAVYCDESGERKYVIGAEYDAERDAYGFHS